MTGILWMDDSDTGLARKLREAANCYRTRFGQPATLCHANPADVPEATLIEGLRVEPHRNIRPNHFLIGRDPREETPEEKAA